LTIAIVFNFWLQFQLIHGTDEERHNFEISGGGFGIHWPQLDEDIGIKGLLLGKKSSESKESFQK